MFNAKPIAHRQSCRGAAYLVLMAAVQFALAGCVKVDPDPGYHRTAALIRSHTAVEKVYTPGLADESTRQTILEMLKDGLTVKEAQRVAVLNNPSLQSMFHEVGVSTADLVQAGLPSNPSLAASVRFPENGEGLTNVSIGVSQGLIDLLLIPIRKRIAEFNLRQAELATAQQAVKLVGDVKRTCYVIQGLKEAERITREDLALTQRTVELVQHRLSAGEGDKLDVDLARAATLEVQRELLAIRRDLDKAHALLGNLLGLSRWTEPWSVVGELPKTVALEATEELMKLAMERRLDARVARLQIEAAGEELQREKMSVFSDITVGFERERADSPPNLSGPTVDVSLPLWHQNQARISRASIAAAGQRRSYEAVLDAVGHDVTKAAASARANARLVKFFETKSLPLGRENVESAARAYKTGLHDILRLTEAQRSLIQQRRAYVTVVKDYAVSLADLEQALGGQLGDIAKSPTTMAAESPATMPAESPKSETGGQEGSSEPSP